MNPPLSHDEHLDVLTCVGELYRCRSLTDFPSQALAALAPLIPSTLSAFNEVNLPRGRICFVTDRALANHSAMEREWERHSGQHPLVGYVRATGDGQAIKFSDFLSVRAYHRLDLYRNYYRLIGAEDQICITIRSDAGIILAIALNRSRRDFTERERVKLNLVRPHLLQAYAQVEEIAGHREEEADLRTALRATGHGVIALDAEGRIAHATPGAQECLARYFPAPRARNRVPAPIMTWLAAGAHAPFTAVSATARLVVRSARKTGHPLLLLSEEIRPSAPDGPRLTAREADVLRWIVAGKTNREIAAILALAPGTVNRHVERILAKLGVANRTAAATLAREHGLIGK